MLLAIVTMEALWLTYNPMMLFLSNENIHDQRLKVQRGNYVTVADDR